MKSQNFSYDQAFDRNIGWLTKEEQAKLRTSCVAIAGVGGAGGFFAQALARLGVGRFKIADLDNFELSNINRQIGASIETLGQPKISIIRDMILSINPHAEVETFEEGINPNTIDHFLDSVNLVLDGIDFFAQKIKRLLFVKSYEKRITALTSCPLGFGASLIIFSPDGMKYDDYFDVNEKMSEKEMRMTCTVGLAPSALCLPYMEKKAFDLKGQRAASVVPGLMLVAALGSTEAVKILTGKRKVSYAPHIYQIDLLTQKVTKKYYPFGMKSPFQRIKRWLFFRLLNTQIYYLLRPRNAADNKIVEELSKT